MFVCLFVCFCNVHVKLPSLLSQTQLKTLINIFQHCSIYLFGFFETSPGRVTLVPLGAIGFDGLIAVDEVTGFSELTACGGATFSSNLVVDISVVLLYDKALFAPNFLFVSTLFPYEIFNKEWFVLRLTNELGCEFKNNKARYSSC